MTDAARNSMPELLSEIEREWKELWRVVGRLTPEQMVTPDAGGWSPKDNLAHLEDWMKILMGYHMDGRAPHEVMGVSEEFTRDWDFEVMNPVLVERSRARDTEDVLSGLKRAYADLSLKLRSTPFETLMQPRYPDNPEQGLLLDWVLGDTRDHFAEHRETIEKSL